MTRITPAETKALKFIADNADVLTVAGKAWLLTPAPAALLDTLAAVGAQLADVEPDADGEAEGEDEPEFGAPLPAHNGTVARRMLGSAGAR